MNGLDRTVECTSRLRPTYNRRKDRLKLISVTIFRLLERGDSVSDRCAKEISSVSGLSIWKALDVEEHIDWQGHLRVEIDILIIVVGSYVAVIRYTDILFQVGYLKTSTRIPLTNELVSLARPDRGEDVERDNRIGTTTITERGNMYLRQATWWSRCLLVACSTVGQNQRWSSISVSSRHPNNGCPIRLAQFDHRPV